MTKEQFLNELQKQLKKLPKQELEDILRDYDEYFQNAQADGKQEREIVQSLGSPRQLAKELLATYYIEEVQKSSSIQNIARAAWAAVGLGFLNVIFILTTYCNHCNGSFVLAHCSHFRPNTIIRTYQHSRLYGFLCMV